MPLTTDSSPPPHRQRRRVPAFDRPLLIDGSPVKIRPYRPADREAVRHICCETGFSGEPVEPLFSDRQLFADFLTRYYTDHEPESSLVAEHRGRVVGYLTGCLRHRHHALVQLWIGVVVAARSLWRLARGRYDAKDRAYVRWCFFRAYRELPSGPPRAAHLHLNLLRPYRSHGVGLRLLIPFLEELRRRGVGRVYGRVETGEGRRPERVFRRLGFHPVERRPISRPPYLTDQPLYVVTVAMELLPD